MSDQNQKIETLITRLEKVARLTERKINNDIENKNVVWFKDMTSFQAQAAIDKIKLFETKTGIIVKSWVDANSENDYDLMIKF